MICGIIELLRQPRSRLEHSTPWRSRPAEDGVRGWVIAGGGVLVFLGLLAWLGSEVRDNGRDPFAIVAVLVTMFLLGVAGGIWHAQRTHRRTWRSLHSLVSAGDRLLGDRSGLRLPASLSGEFAPVVDLINRFAALRDATAATLADRDEQIAALQRLGSLIYCEQDEDGRFTRIESTDGRSAALATVLLGRTRWDDGGTWLGRTVEAAAAGVRGSGGWRTVRDAPALRNGRFELVWTQPLMSGRAWLHELTEPRLDANGAFVGWRSVIRDASDPLASARHALNLAGAMRVATQPTLLIEAAGDPPGWRVVWLNAAACALFGRSEAELLASAAADLFAPADAEVAERVGASLRIAQGLRCSPRVIDRYAVSHQVTLRLDPVPAIEGMPLLAALSLDRLPAEALHLRSERARIERLLDAQQSRIRDLEIAARELESFSASVSHDLRAPLRVVDGFARLLKDDFGHTFDRVAHDHVDRITSAAARMNRMIDALLKLARVSSEPIESEPVDLSALARQVVDELQAEDPQRSALVSIEPGLTTRGDRVLLRILLENLIGNAWKYTGRCARAEISFGARREAGSTVFTVSDNGAGFDARFADRLFQVFQRLHGADEFPGTGVGLATAARIVKRHRGRIWADSVPGEGARFHFTLDEAGA